MDSENANERHLSTVRKRRLNITGDRETGVRFADVQNSRSNLSRIEESKYTASDTLSVTVTQETCV